MEWRDAIKAHHVWWHDARRACRHRPWRGKYKGHVILSATADGTNSPYSDEMEPQWHIELLVDIHRQTLYIADGRWTRGQHSSQDTDGQANQVL